MKIVTEEHWAKKGPVKLYVYRKHDADWMDKPVLFLVHGSTFSSRGTYDVVVDGNIDYSAMEHFARLGYACITCHMRFRWWPTMAPPWGKPRIKWNCFSRLLRAAKNSYSSSSVELPSWSGRDTSTGQVSTRRKCSVGAAYACSRIPSPSVSCGHTESRVSWPDLLLVLVDCHFSSFTLAALRSVLCSSKDLDLQNVGSFVVWRAVTEPLKDEG